MIKYYYASITDKSLYIDDINFLEYLNNYFPNVYSSYQDMLNRDKLINIDKYKEDRLYFNRKLEEEGISPYLLLKKQDGELREINTNNPLGITNIKKPKLKELTKEEIEVLYTDNYIKRTNRYFYLPFALENNPIFDLDYEEEKRFKIIKKTN